MDIKNRYNRVEGYQETLKTIMFYATTIALVGVLSRAGVRCFIYGKVLRDILDC